MDKKEETPPKTGEVCPAVDLPVATNETTPAEDEFLIRILASEFDVWAGQFLKASQKLSRVSAKVAKYEKTKAAALSRCREILRRLALAGADPAEVAQAQDEILDRELAWCHPFAENFLFGIGRHGWRARFEQEAKEHAEWCETRLLEARASLLDDFKDSAMKQAFFRRINGIMKKRPKLETVTLPHPELDYYFEDEDGGRHLWTGGQFLESVRKGEIPFGDFAKYFKAESPARGE